MSAEERVAVESAGALNAWLSANHGHRESVWLVLWKKHTGERYIPYEEVVRTALAWGWIDSLPRALDADRSMLRLSPREPTSAWSAVNKSHIEALIAAGRMQPPGLAVVEAAKANGAWSFLDDVEAGMVPADLEAAFEEHPGAEAYFNAFPKSARRGILEWIKQAKRPETRRKRVTETARLAAQNIRANMPRQPKR